MVRVNLVYASYAGTDAWSSRRTYVGKEHTLRISLQNYLSLKHSLSQITVMKAKVNGTMLENFYDLDQIKCYLSCPLIEHDINNYGFSAGQFFGCYEIYKDKFDYYIFVEDDYTMNIDNFDQTLVDIYRNYFPDNIGVLTSLKPIHQSLNFIDHWEGILMVSRETMDMVYHNPKWAGDPRRLIETMRHPRYSVLRNGPGQNGGLMQLTSSLLFTESGVKINDYIGKYTHIYWDCGKYLIFNTDNKHIENGYLKVQDNLSIKPSAVNQSLLIPMQLCRRCILVLSMHRSGSSMASNCIYSAGIDYGISKTTVKDKYNADGYFENQEILHFNEMVLRKMKSGWGDTTPITSQQRVIMLKFVGELIKIIEKEYSSLNQFFVKDPRIIFLYPLYAEALRRMHILPHYVVLERDTHEIAQSLERAQNYPYKKGVELTEKYHKLLSLILADKEYIKTNMNSIIKNPIEFVKKIEAYLNRRLLSVDNLNIIRSIPREELRNYNRNL